jgi:hypothetical protein
MFVTVGNCRCSAGPLPPGDSDLTLQLIHMAFRQRGCSIGMAFIPSFVKISRLVEMVGGILLSPRHVHSERVNTLS